MRDGRFGGGAHSVGIKLKTKKGAHGALNGESFGACFCEKERGGDHEAEFH